MPTITTTPIDATWTNGVAMDEAELRRSDSAMFLGDGSNSGVRGGVVRHGDTSLAVSVNGSDQVTVQPGAAVIPAATGLGVYRAALSAATAATGISPRNATNPRIDLVVMQIVSGQAVVQTVDGTPGASPSAPALPANAVELARLTVPAVAGGAVTVSNAFRSYATGLGGTLYVETAARLPGSGNTKGQRAVALDTGLSHTHDGTAWNADGRPRGVLGYATSTGVQVGIVAETDVSGLGVAVTVGASRRIKITVHTHSLRSVADGVTRLRIKEGTTVLQIFDIQQNIAAASHAHSGSAIITPSAGAHTYLATLERATGTGSVDTFTSATQVGYILVEDIGPA